MGIQIRYNGRKKTTSIVNIVAMSIKYHVISEYFALAGKKFKKIQIVFDFPSEFLTTKESFAESMASTVSMYLTVTWPPL